jgi:hypothetical protein
MDCIKHLDKLPGCREVRLTECRRALPGRPCCPSCIERGKTDVRARVNSYSADAEMSNPTQRLQKAAKGTLAGVQVGTPCNRLAGGSSSSRPRKGLTLFGPLFPSYSSVFDKRFYPFFEQDSFPSWTDVLRHSHRNWKSKRNMMEPHVASDKTSLSGGLTAFVTNGMNQASVAF